MRSHYMQSRASKGCESGGGKSECVRGKRGSGEEGRAV